MITDILITILIELITFLIGVLPQAGELPEQIFDWVPYFKTGQQFLASFIAFDTFFILVGYMITIEGLLIVYKISRIVYKMIRG